MEAKDIVTHTLVQNGTYILQQTTGAIGFMERIGIINLVKKAFRVAASMFVMKIWNHCINLQISAQKYL